MMKRAKGLAAGMLLLVLTSGTLSLAHPPLFLAKANSWQRELARELDLTVSQLRALNKLQRERREAIKRVMESTPSPLKASFRGGEFKPGLYEKLRLQRAKLLSKIEAEFLKRLYGILTPAQRAKFREFVAGRVRAFR